MMNNTPPIMDIILAEIQVEKKEPPNTPIKQEIM